MVVHNCNPSTWEAEAGDHIFDANLGYITRPCLNPLPPKNCDNFHGNLFREKVSREGIKIF
jgi:hypothetical protein